MRRTRFCCTSAQRTGPNGLAVALSKHALAFYRPHARRTNRRARRRREPSRISSTSRRSTAGSGRAITPDERGCRSSTASRPARSARSRSRRAIRRSSTPAAAKACSAPISPSATASTNRPTAAQRGRISVCATGSRSLRWPSTPPTRTGSSSRCSAIRTDRTPSAASIARSTAARLSSACSIRTTIPADSTSFSIRAIRKPFTRRFGRRGRRRGRSARRSKSREAASLNRVTAERRGRS